MRIGVRILLLIVALSIGGLFGYYLLVDFTLPKMLFFGVICYVLGYLFHAVDKKIMGDNLKN
ncbi:MAG: hypothetical protein K0R46_1211 [Herbinix sp.]|jgi:hypothetical protein|nr:hypothetical protein [Herbinix sp.]